MDADQVCGLEEEHFSKKKKKVDIYLAFSLDDNTQAVTFQFVSRPELQSFCNSPLFHERL